MPYLDDIYTEVPADRFEMDDWREFIGTEQPGGGEAFSLESGEATVVNLLDWGKARSFLRFVLGFSYADRANPFRLRRENPVFHPRFSWLSATTVSFASISPVGVQGAGTKVEGAFPATAGVPPVAKYAKILATVRFTDRPWTFLEDEFATTPATEAERNTFFEPVPSVEVISAEGLNNIKFANGPQAGEVIPAPFGTLMSKITKTLNWMWVPHEYISGDDPLQFTPDNIMSCVGRVNSDTFLGHPPGTLLLQAPVFQRFRFPVLTRNNLYGYFAWNIKLPMQFFDPPRGVADANYRGHQLVPRRTDLLWYGAIREDGSSKLFPEAPFANIFKHIDAP